LFGFLVIFVTLFTVFLLLGIYWHYRRRLHDVLEFDEVKDAHKGVPKLWEVWVEDEPNQWEWENVRVSFPPTPFSPQAMPPVYASY
jgi:hypothetical protein